MLKTTSPVDEKFRTDYEFRGNCSSSPEGFPVLVLGTFSGGEQTTKATKVHEGT